MLDFLTQNLWLLIIVGASLIGAVWATIYYLTYAIRSQILGATIWNGDARENLVALTFDDGPAPETLQILDFLKAENITATFFLIGERVSQYPEIARRIAAENHEIGNHSYSHPIFLFCSRRKTKRELEKTQEIIESVTGIRPKIARPPCGVRSAAYFAATREFGLKTVQWSDAGFDWTKITPEKIARHILKNVRNDSIILLHDGDSAAKSDRLATVAALPLILRGLQEKGLRIAPLATINSEFYESGFEAKAIARANDRKELV